MAITFAFYHDAALTQIIDGSNPLTATQDTVGALGAVDKTIYLGSTTVGNKLQVTTDPGVDPVVIDIADSGAGTGAPDTEFKLALSSGGLASATAGASLSLSHTLTSGVANAIPIYTRRTSALIVVGAYSDISLQIANPYETPV